MEDVQAFLPRIKAAGFTLEAEGADLVVRPFSRLSESQKAFIRQHKPEILAALVGKDHESGPRACPDEDVIVEFTDWRLPSGRRVAFKLAIPSGRYDGFELLELLEKLDQGHVVMGKGEV